MYTRSSTTRGFTLVEIMVAMVIFGVSMVGTVSFMRWVLRATDLSGRLTFVSSGLDKPYAALAILDDPKGERSKIEAAVRAGFIVRTRADADVVEAISNDHSREQAAWASGAQIVSTDFPVKVGNYDYSTANPGGTPSRCNPRLGPTGCTSADIETL